MTASQGTGVAAFVAARDFLFKHREDYATAYRDFRWPELGEFNWALDWFDAFAQGNDAPALWIVDEDGREDKVSFARMSERSAQVANWLRDQLAPLGVGVVLEAEHTCMTLRGVNTPGSTLTTSRLLGVIRDDPRTRQEFLRLANGG